MSNEDRRCKGKGKAVPLQASSGPEGSRNLRFPDFTTTAQDGGKVVSLKQFVAESNSLMIESSLTVCCMSVNKCQMKTEGVKVKVKQFRYRPGVAQRVPGN